MTRILFVCRGNTCRSPLAEAVARRLHARDAIMPVLQFASAGVAPAAVGAPASAGALSVAAVAGLDLSAHRTRAADAAILEAADLIVALDRSVRADLLARMAPQHHARLSLLMSFAPELGRDDVTDPWGGSAADYAHAFRLIELAVGHMLSAFASDVRRDQPP